MYAVTPKALAWLIFWAGVVYVAAHIAIEEYSIQRIGNMLQL